MPWRTVCCDPSRGSEVKRHHSNSAAPQLRLPPPRVESFEGLIKEIWLDEALPARAATR
jgi:hypothetical protein